MKDMAQKEAMHPQHAALGNCAAEPIHRPGRVQGFGALIAGEADLSTVSFASENLDRILGVAARDILGGRLEDVIGRKPLHDARNLLTLSSTAAQRERVGSYEVNGRAVEMFVHRNPNGQAVLEFEPFENPDAAAIETPIDRMRMVLGQAAAQRSIERFLQVCVTGLRQLTGYDRVMAYRYLASGDGEVVAESRAGTVEGFLGLRYPSWDVPAQARALQVRNPVRMLADVHAEPVALLGDGADPDTLDMALAHTRGISDVHVRYLSNMGVGATLTIGLVVDGRLWGMFACHHMGPRVIRSDTRIAAELFGQLVSLMIQQKQEVESVEAREAAGEARRRILAETDATTEFLSAFPEIAPILSEVVRCDGLAVVREGALETSGSVPAPEAIQAIAARLPAEDNLLVATDMLARAEWAGDADLRQSAGCLQVRCTAAAPLQLMFFRDAVPLTVSWAGRPEKDIDVGPGGVRLSPRASFEAYVEKMADRSSDFTAFDIEAGRELQRLLTQITTKGERAQLARHKDLVNSQRQQDLMIAELNHRVKNILALIRSLSRQAKASSNSLESYAQALEQRIAALASAHDLAVSNTMQGVSLRGILQAEFRPYLDGDGSQAILAGPTVGLRADVAPMIALVFHELVSNAAKYGALSTRDGIVQARWKVDADGLHVSWREVGGPEVAPPTRHGFGRSLIERAIPYEFDGEVVLDYPASGVTMSFRLPPDTLVDLESDGESRLVGEIGKVKKIGNGLKALIVEDNLVLAMDMVESLTRLGTASVETAGTIEEAMRHVERGRFDFAVLDMNLRGTVSFELAERLRSQGVPLIFVTGYGSGMEVPPSLASVRVLTKPVDDGTLSTTLAAVLP